MATIDAWVAGLRVLEDWGIKNVYGLPAGSLNSLMDAFEKEQGKINFIQVRHEETGALAASMSAKFTGKIAACIGSAGPGATHLYNGLYDAKEDNVPVLAIIGQRPEVQANYDMFQEFNQNPYFADVAVYNRRVAYAEQLPKVLDEAIRTAIARKGVAAVEVPVSFGWEPLEEDSWYSSAKSYRDYPLMTPGAEDIDEAVKVLAASERPIIYAGIGTQGSGQDVVELSKKIKAPVVVTGINFDNFDYDFDALLGSAYRVAWKPANEALEEADTILFAGSNFPFAEVEGTFDHVKHFIQIDIDQQKLGKRHDADVSILGDAGEAIRQITEKIEEKTDNGWYKANIDNAKNWKDYLQSLEQRESGELQLFQVYHAINQVADEDAVYSIDVGNTTQTSIRHLHMTPKNTWRTSNIFATMGNGLPGAIAAKLEMPDRQVWNLAGDGGFSMAMQDIVTAVKYKLPMINVVFTNERFGFIRDEQENTNDNFYGIDIADVDFAMIGKAQGAVAYTVTEISQLKEVFSQAVADEKDGKVVVIDCKISLDRPIPVEHLELDSKLHSKEDIAKFKERYYAEELKPLTDFLEAEGVEIRQYQWKETL
ncbi:pyruvate oxidase [Aerococcus sp. JJEM-2022b]|uniref:pyruvate oxidase n=1 Tax=Aerococcus mictus TaxID=2976810 RepID=UPI00227BD26B|nr:pyruvate oxidase [Aerococcus mictus]MCY3064813.1 pyruvate oxidase [Aerococcus mictus]